MQVSKAALVATGALAATAAIGSTPAFAADSEAIPAVAPATVNVLDHQGKHRASDEAMRQLAAHWLTAGPEQAAELPPWVMDDDDSQVVSLGSRSGISLANMQQCGSSVLPILQVDSPNTAMGPCANGNVVVANDGDDSDDSVISILDDTVITAANIQQCGSSVLPILQVDSPNTAMGACVNGNGVAVSGMEPMEPAEPPDGEPGVPYTVTQPMVQGDEEGLEQADVSPDGDDRSVISVLTDSVVTAANIQQCGGSVLPILQVDSPNTAMGACVNGNVVTGGSGNGAGDDDTPPYYDDGDDVTEIANGDSDDRSVISVLTDSVVTAANIQQCGGSVLPILQVDSPNTSMKPCANGNVLVGGGMSKDIPPND
jgi:hypothetical protein